MKSDTLIVETQGNLKYIKFPKLEKCGLVNHIFSTRHGGVSEGDAASMNLSFSKDSKRQNVIKNFEILCRAANIEPSHLVLSHQTHTNNVICVDKSHCGVGITKPCFEDVDGLITNNRGVALVTQYADCTPLILCDPIRKVVATSHAGWRGTVKLIGKVTVDKMVHEFGCERHNIIAAIGPCIKQCCYEVDLPVFQEFEKIEFLDTDSIFKFKEDGKYMLDLIEANRQILSHAGILAENMDISDLCTCCNHKELHSHRATNGKRGNLAAIIELK